MHHEDRRFFHVAASIRETLSGQQSAQFQQLSARMARLLEFSTGLSAIRLQSTLLAGRDWNGAASQLLFEAHRLLRDIGRETDMLLSQPLFGSAAVPSMRELVDDLRALADEFDGFRVDPAEGTVSVTTEPIALEDIYLGPFAVVLRIDSLPNADYSVVALSPTPAACNEEVTHPHVSGGELCEGEANSAISSALRQGRLLDFFVIVRSVLTTYNPHSPYVSLDNWDGRPCNDCGRSMSEDDEFYCESCDHTYCEDCYRGCEKCGELLCDGCLVRCDGCDERFCKDCLDRCSDCAAPCCTNCMSPCENCEEIFCEDCLDTCKRCDRKHCGSCMEEQTCGDCEKDIGENAPQGQGGTSETGQNNERSRDVAVQAGAT